MVFRGNNAIWTYSLTGLVFLLFRSISPLLNVDRVDKDRKHRLRKESMIACNKGHIQQSSSINRNSLTLLIDIYYI